jgi:hypothetical protein
MFLVDKVEMVDEAGLHWYFTFVQPNVFLPSH